MTYKTVEVDARGFLCTLRLNRPQVRNAFNAEMIGELTEIFGELASLPNLRAVVLRGNGPAFSAGADVSWMRSSLDFTEQENLEDAGRMSDMFHAIDSLPIPVVTRVHGAALGGGMGLIAVSDIVVAEEGAVFGFSEARLGIIPAVISRFVLPKIGESWARALFLTAERFGPQLARDIHLVHWVVPPERLDETVDGKVQELLACGPEAVKAAKALIRDAANLDRDHLRDFTVERIAVLRRSPEGQEGLRAFLERRRPGWTSDE